MFGFRRRGGIQPNTEVTALDLYRPQYTRATPPGQSPPGGGGEGGMGRWAGDALSTASGFLKGPWGIALAGAPIAIDAIGQLNNPGGDTVGNLSGAVGSVGGGVGGMILGGLLTGGNPLGIAAGSWLGSLAGGTTTRAGSELVRNMDPLGKQIKQNERLADSQFDTWRRHAEAALPLQQLQAESARRIAQKDMMDRLQVHAMLRYQDAMLQAPYATASPVDMSPFAAIAQSAMRA